MKILHFLFIVFFSYFTNAQDFQGHAGIYVLGQVDVPMPTSEYAKPYVSGAAVRTSWATIEPTEGNFQWSFLDTEIANATAAGKKISISILGNPTWLASAGVPMYDYIDIKPTSPTFGQTLQAPITWSNEFVAKLTTLIQQLGIKYANNPTVTYVNAIAGKMNNNLPSTVANGTDFWTATGYNANTLIAKMNQMTDVFMTAFPNTGSWNSLENISFEIPASGNPNNYVITQFANYGSATYPNRFGVWREDLAGCSNITSTTGHWGVVASHPCRTGAQMLWNVQDGADGTYRMNNCSLPITTKEEVLQAAFNLGFTMNMRYFEVYKVDVDDTSLSTILQNNLTSITGIVNNCTTLGVEDFGTTSVSIYPNPTKKELFVSTKNEIKSIQIINPIGQTIINKNINSQSTAINVENLAKGMYIVSITSSDYKIENYKFLKE